MNRVTVNIQGFDYTLVGSESEEYLNTIGFTVNKMIDSMLKSNKKLNMSSAAILTACNLVDDNMKLEKLSETIKDKENSFSLEKIKLEKEINALKEQLSAKDIEIENAKGVESESLKLKDEEIKKSQSEVKLLQESVKEYRDDNEKFSKVNKELKFELQSYKYKVLDLQNKLFENQMNGTKDKKNTQAKVKEEE
ncbi:MAG: cell division protein ZapA [Clostridiaceae bacterium]